jgi:hypothetical protein
MKILLADQLTIDVTFINVLSGPGMTSSTEKLKTPETETID